MAKDSRYMLKIAFDDKEKEQLMQLVRNLSDQIGVELSISWVIKTLVRLTLEGAERTTPAEALILLQMYTMANYNSDIHSKFQLG